MARGINKVILVGNLGNDPETKYTQGGMAVTSISLATTSVRKDKEGNTQERTEWHRVKFFGKLGEIAGEYLRKGSSVYVEGSIRYDKFTGQDGVEKYFTDIVADEMQMLGGRGEGGGGGGGGAPRAERSGGDRPQRSAPAAPGRRAASRIRGTGRARLRRRLRGRRHPVLIARRPRPGVAGGHRNTRGPGEGPSFHRRTGAATRKALEADVTTWLVTGGAGFIGGNFVLDARARAACRVVNLDALTYAGNLDTLAPLDGDPNHVFVHGDIGDRALVDRLLREHTPDAVVNFAAESHVDRSIDGPAAFVQTNVVGTLALLESARDYWKCAAGRGEGRLPLPARVHRRGLRLARRHRQVHRRPRRTRPTRRTRRRRPRPTTWCAPSTTPTACRC